MKPEELCKRLEALPGAIVAATDHASVGYDMDVRLPECALFDAVTLMDEAGYFLEGMTGVDWLGERETLIKEAEAKAKAASAAAETAAAEGDAPPSGQELPPSENAAFPAIPEEDELEVVYDFNLFEVSHRVTLRVRTPRSNPQVHTIAGLYPIAHWHEREIHEFFGIVFIGHPYLIPLLLPEDADYHPLLKDYGA